MFLALLTLLSALILSSTAAYFSVTGLAAIFSATIISVVIMGIGLESSKIVTALWLHKNWKNKNVSILIKLYLSIAILLLMMITDIGIFGYLSAGHLTAVTPTKSIQVQIDAIDQKIASDQKTIDRANQQLSELDKSLDTYFKNNAATKGLKARAAQKPERDQLTKEISDCQKDIDTLNSQEEPLKQQMIDVSQKLGPIKYVAALFYSNPTQDQMDTSVRYMILLIMSVFDPLAIMLVVGAGISLREYLDEKKKIKDTNILQSKPQPTPQQVSTAKNPNQVNSYLEKKLRLLYDKYLHTKLPNDK